MNHDNDVATTSQEVTILKDKEPTQSEMEALFANLNCGDAKPLVLSLIPQIMYQNLHWILFQNH